MAAVAAHQRAVHQPNAKTMAQGAAIIIQHRRKYRRVLRHQQFRMVAEEAARAARVLAYRRMQQRKKWRNIEADATVAASQRLQCLHNDVQRRFLQRLAADTATNVTERNQRRQQQHNLRSSIAAAAATSANLRAPPNETQHQSRTAGTTTPKPVTSPPTRPPTADVEVSSYTLDGSSLGPT